MLLPVVYQAMAQKAPATDAPKGPKHDQSIGITTGAQGFGAEYRYGLFSSLNLRAGFSYLPLSRDNVFKLHDLNSNNTVSAKFTGISLLADFTPFKGFGFLRIVGGASYLVQANGHVFVQPTDAYKYGDIALSQDQVGNLDMDVNWKGIAPYAGLGFVHAFPKKKFNINLDLGVYHLVAPTAQMTGTGLLAGNSSQSSTLQNNVSDIRWAPKVQLNFNFKL